MSHPVVAIRGAGSIGLRHAQVLHELGARVLVVPSRRERVHELRALGFSAIAGEELPPVDGVVVCTETGAHSRAALEDGASPILVEKPLAADVAGAQQLIDWATRAGKTVHVAYCLRFNPGITFVRERLPAIGKIHGADAECLSWLPSWRKGRDFRLTYSADLAQGGVLLDLSHELDLLNSLLGRGRCIAATSDTARVLGLDPRLDESVSLVTRHGHVDATVRLSFARRPESRRLRLFGVDGCLEWDAVARRAQHTDASGRVIDACVWEDNSEMYACQASAWLATLSGEQQSGLATAQDGVAALEIVDAARQIASRGDPH